MKIICFLPNYIGDVLMVTPTLRLLKNFLPYAEINVVVKKNLLELLEGNFNIDNFIIKSYDRFELLKNILKLRPNYAVLFRTTFFNSLITYLAKTKISVGTNEELSFLFLTKTLKIDAAIPFRTQCLMLVEELLRSLNINKSFDTKELKKIDFYSWNNQEIKYSLNKKLIENNVDINKKFIIISPCASRKTKVLTIQQYVEIIKLLYKKYKNNYEIVLVNSKEDEMIKKIIQESGYLIKSLCSKINLKELGYLFSISSLVISADSGPAYIAESVGVKTLIYFTSTLPEKYGPYSENVKFFYLPTICSPCYKNFCPLKTYECINKIKPEDIVSLVDTMLE